MTSQTLLSGFTILLIIQFICAWLIGACQITFPAPLLGMIVLTLLLVTKTIKTETIEGICSLFLEKMGILFVPGAVGAIRYMEHISKEIVPIIATIFVSGAIVLIVTGVFLQFLLHHKGGNKHA